MRFGRSLVRAVTFPFRLPGLLRARDRHRTLQANLVIARMDRLAAQVDRAIAGDQALRNRYDALVPEKLDLIDFAFERIAIASFADLGGTHAHPPSGYALYTAEKYGTQRALVVDTDASDGLESANSLRPAIEFIKGNFSSPAVAAEVGDVDAVFLFDVLCLQGKPSWREVLQLYASRARCLIVTSAQFDRFAKSTRLMDLDESAYYECVPREYAADARTVNLFAVRDQAHPEHGCLHRDSPQYWQWAITDDDLIETMRDLGFRLVFLKPLFAMDNIPTPGVETRGFVFVRR
jgi:hypothetical protein